MDMLLLAISALRREIRWHEDDLPNCGCNNRTLWELYSTKNSPVRVWDGCNEQGVEISNGNALTCGGLEVSELAKLGGKLSLLRSH
jgi:hypothetical protein